MAWTQQNNVIKVMNYYSLKVGIPLLHIIGF